MDLNFANAKRWTSARGLAHRSPLNSNSGILTIQWALKWTSSKTYLNVLTIFFVSFMNSPFIMSCVDVPLKYGNALSALATPALTVRNAYCVRMKWYSTGMARNATE